jgi:hypothetical protein
LTGSRCGESLSNSEGASALRMRLEVSERRTVCVYIGVTPVCGRVVKDNTRHKEKAARLDPMSYGGWLKSCRTVRQYNTFRPKRTSIRRARTNQ